MKKKAATIMLACIMALGGSIGAFADTSETKDFSGHWAEETIKRRIADGVVPASMCFEFRPDENISRIEFVNMINGFFNFQNTWDVSYSDVDPESAYETDVEKAAWMGYAEGYEDGTFRPLGEITRAEAAKMINLVIDRKEIEKEVLSSCSDNEDIQEWSREALAFSVGKGYLSGYPDGTLRPNSPMTRAEALTLMDRVCGRVFSQPGVYGPESGTEKIQGNATVVSAGVELRNMEIEGDLNVTAGLGDGEVLFSDVVVEGEKYIKGGGTETLDCFAEDEHVLTVSDVSIPGMWKFEISGVSINVEEGSIAIQKDYMEDDGTISQAAVEDAKEQSWRSVPTLPNDTAFVSFDVKAPREGRIFKAVAYHDGRVAEYDIDLLDYTGDENSKGYISNVFVIFEMDEDGEPILPDYGTFELGIVFAWYYEDGSVERTSFRLECK